MKIRPHLNNQCRNPDIFKGLYYHTLFKHCQTSAQIVLQSTRFISALPGDKVTFDCSMAAGVSMSSYTMYWYKQDHYGQAVQFIIKEYEKTPQNYEAIMNTKDNMFSLTVSNLTAQDSSTYYCAASHSEARTVPAHFGNGTKLTVLDPDVTITEPTLKILNTTRCKEKVTLVCVAENFYPDHVSIKWTLGDKEITEDVATDPYATKDENTKMFNISSRLKVSKKEFTPKKTFRCTVTFNNSTHVSEKTVYITGTGGISLDIS
uniref:Ig-like domain-containing protein n=1 Tax=Cyprinus carpio TaxID=7962 RepID=A0A8C2G5N1_CYPCA